MVQTGRRGPSISGSPVIGHSGAPGRGESSGLRPGPRSSSGVAPNLRPEGPPSSRPGSPWSPVPAAGEAAATRERAAARSLVAAASPAAGTGLQGLPGREEGGPSGLRFGATPEDERGPGLSPEDSPLPGAPE